MRDRAISAKFLAHSVYMKDALLYFQKFFLFPKMVAEIALSRTVKEIQAILSFTIFVKNSKIQNGRHFWKEEKFLRIEQSIVHI